MKNISVFVEGGTKKLKLDQPIATYGSRLTAREVTVFWNFKNITSALDNGKFVIKDGSGLGIGTEKSLGEGYWDFKQLKERLEAEKLELSMNVYNNTCTILNKTGSAVDLKNFGKLLGFPANHTLPTGSTSSPSTTLSPKPVDVNHGLRFIYVKCDLVDSTKTLDFGGDQSTVLAFLPVPPGTRLTSTCYVYERNNAWRQAIKGLATEINFSVASNIKEKVDVDILLNIVIE